MTGMVYASLKGCRIFTVPYRACMQRYDPVHVCLRPCHHGINQASAESDPCRCCLNPAENSFPEAGKSMEPEKIVGELN
jgi:hypothetical protein